MNKSSRVKNNYEQGQGLRHCEPNVNIRSQQERQQHQDEKQRAPISVRLSINTKSCKAGGHIHGKISMFVPQTAKGCDDFSGIHLYLMGEEIVNLHRELAETRRVSQTRRKNILRISTEVVSLPGPLNAGQFEYPFCWQLPADKTLPTTMSCTSADGSSCQLEYSLTAHLSSKSSESTKYPATFSRKPICILGHGKNVMDDNDNGCNDNHSNITAEPKIFKIKSWLKNKGCIELGLDTDKKVVSPSSMVAVSITGRGNLSSVPVKELLIQLVETVEWGVLYEGERKQRRVLAQTIVSVDEAPQWQTQRRNKNSDKESTMAPDFNHSNRVSRYLTLNKIARDSYEGNMIKVQHSISVTAKTKGYTNPKVTTPIDFCRKQPKQTEYGSSSKAAPVMAKAQLCSVLGDDAESTDHSNYDALREYKIRQDVETPHAVPINSDSYNNFGCPIVIGGEMEHQNASGT